MKTTHRVLIGCIFLVLILAPLTYYVFAVESSTQYHNLSDSTTASYLEYGEAIKVTNNCGKELFISANSSAEWTSFNDSTIGCITKTNDFIECAASATGSTCTGSAIEDGTTGIETWSACKSWAEGRTTGTCLRVLTAQDTDCRLYDGTVSGSGTTSGSCTDYD